MPVVVSFPDHMQAVADEERYLLQRLRQLVPLHRQHPSFTLLARNEILKTARELLVADEWNAFHEFVDELTLSMDHDGIVGFPLPCFHDLNGALEAETLAESFLQEGSGSQNRPLTSMPDWVQQALQNTPSQKAPSSPGSESSA